MWTTRTSTRRPRPADGLRRRSLAPLALAAAALVVLIVLPASASAEPRAKTRVTIIGDSIMASFDYVSSARRSLGRGFDLRSDNAVCRRLVTASCPHGGSTPATAYDIVRTRGGTLGKVVVINVGYNDWPAVYDVDRMMRALERAGVATAIWVTLRESSAYASLYAQSNARIRKAGRRWKNLVVADWNAHSRGRSWFGSDGLHLTPAGAKALARLLRPLVVAAARR